MQPTTLNGALIIAVGVLASAVGFLFRLYLTRNKEIEALTTAKDKEMAKERSDWAVERERIDHEGEVKEAKIRAEYEQKFRELIQRYDEISRRDSESNRKHEDQVRKEFADIMERVSAESGKSASALVQMLQKFYDRMVGPRGGGY